MSEVTPPSAYEAAVKSVRPDASVTYRERQRSELRWLVWSAGQPLTPFSASPFNAWVAAHNALQMLGELPKT